MAHPTTPLLAGCIRPPCVLLIAPPPCIDPSDLQDWLRPTGDAYEGPGPAPQPCPRDDGDPVGLAEHLSDAFHRLYIPPLQGLVRRTLGNRGTVRVDATWTGGFLARMEADHHHAWRPTDDHLIAVQGAIHGTGPLIVLPAPTHTAQGTSPSAHARVAAAQAWAQVPRWAWDGPPPASFVWA